MDHSPNGVNGSATVQSLGLAVDPFGRLVLTDPSGATHVGVEPVRAFPLSDPNHWIALVDAEGHEVVNIESLDDVAPDVKKLLEAELATREFVPIVQRVVRISGDIFPAKWTVETDRGATVLELDSEDDIRRIESHRVLITDARKMRYQVPDTRKLDAHSRRVLERYL
ncbi:MAG: DUF1854 domain-containing protein [Isosphaeraceae bacterium]|nr:DUF1854 domain-containing protein [Isosphaeraceae bacterium]